MFLHVKPVGEFCSFTIHGRTPTVERLYFHLPNEQSVFFNDEKDMDSLLSKPSEKESMFTSWMQTNEIYSEGKILTYTEFVTKLVYFSKNRCWQPRKQGYTIGRLNWVPLSVGELFYLRMILDAVKGPCSYKEIRTVSGSEYLSFQEACFAMGFLHADTKYIEAIKQASKWGSGYYLKKLFVTMLISNSINKHENVWEYVALLSG